MDCSVVPTIFSLDVGTFKKKVDILKHFSSYVHIDVCDGEFVSTKTVSLVKCADVFSSSKLSCEVHLMVENPLNYLEILKKYSPKLVYVQVEIFSSVDELEKIISEFSKIGSKIGLVFNPKTFVEEYVAYLSVVDTVMLMSVYPGAEGQRFDEKVLRKVRELKLLKPTMVVQIDGGISSDTGVQALQAGVDRLAVGSYITSSNSPKENFLSLRALFKK